MRISRISSIFILLGILLATILNSCTSSIRKSDQDYFEKKYTVETFSKIMLEGAYNVELIQGEESSLLMETSDELHEKVKVWVTNGMLYVRTNVKNIGNDEIKLYITFNQLEKIEIEGGAFLRTKGFINVEDIDIVIKGGAHIDMQITARKITARAEGGVNMQFEGVADEFIAFTEGAGNIDADELKAKKVMCSVTGVGNASVFATDELNATVEGIGKISYRGDPEIYKQVNGIGVVYKK